MEVLALNITERMDPVVEPWEQILQLEAEDDGDGLVAMLDSLTPSETARALSRLNHEAQERLVAMLDAEHGAKVLHEVMGAQAADLLDHLSPAAASTLISELPSAEKADILSDLDAASVAAILDQMPREEAASTKVLLEYPKDCAGGLMSTEALSFPDHWTVRQLIDDFNVNHETYAKYTVQYAFLTSADNNRLSGVLNFRNVLLAPRSRKLSELMLADPLSVGADATLDDLIEVFEKHDFLGVPVTDEGGRLAGLVRRSQVMEAAEQRTSASYLRASGIVGGEELRSMPLRVRTQRRLSWLSVNIGLNVIAASVIALYQDTLASVIALAVFLPIISDMSGCSGNQAVAVSIRELTLGLLKPYELARVFLKEIGVGVINGIALGGLLGLVAYAWQGNPYLGLVVGGALMVNTVVAVCLGGLIPLMLQRFGKDPALASGPLLTTVTDLCGFFFALSFASALLGLLV